MMFTTAEWREGWKDSSSIAYDITVKEIEEGNHYGKEFNERIATIFYKYRDILDASYHRLLSESRDLEKLIQFAPGFLVL